MFSPNLRDGNDGCNGEGGCWRPLPCLTSRIYLIKEIIFLSGNSQGVLKSESLATMSVGTYERNKE